VECRACPAGLKSQRFADNSGAEVEKMLGDEWWITMVSGCLWMVSGCLWMFLDVYGWFLDVYGCFWMFYGCFMDVSGCLW
jgi:hypothetical protein